MKAVHQNKEVEEGRPRLERVDCRNQVLRIRQEGKPKRTQANDCCHTAGKNCCDFVLLADEVGQSDADAKVDSSLE